VHFYLHKCKSVRIYEHKYALIVPYISISWPEEVQE